MSLAELDALVSEVKKGDTAKYALIVNGLQQPIYRYCCQLLNDRHEAEDAVQDILVKAFQAIHQYESKMNFAAWIYRIAHNHRLNLLRKRRVHMQVMRLFRPNMTAESPEQLMDSRMYNSELQGALLQLTAEERSLLILRVFEEKSYAEISKIMNLSPNALTKRMMRIKKKMQKLIMLKEEMNWSDIKKLQPNSEI